MKAKNIDDALLQAALRGNLEKVREITASGKCNIDAVNFTGRTALIHAIQSGTPQTLDIMKLLIEYGANTNERIQSEIYPPLGGCTPLMLVRIWGGGDRKPYRIIEEVKCLVEHGRRYPPSSDMRVSLTGGSGGCANVNLTAMSGNYNALDLYILGRSPGENISDEFLEVVDYLIECGIDIHTRENSRGTPLSYAVEGLHKKIAEHLVKRKEFSLCDLMPKPTGSHMVELYKLLRELAVQTVLENLESNDVAYARKVAGDIETLMESKLPILRRQSSDTISKNDTKALESIAKKIAPMDWVADAQVSSDAFLGCEMER